MFFNSWIGLFNDSYLFLGMCAAINFNYFYFNTPGNTFNSLISITVTLIIFAYPIFVLAFYNLKKMRSNIQNNDENFFGRYGQVLEGLNF